MYIMHLNVTQIDQSLRSRSDIKECIESTTVQHSEVQLFLSTGMQINENGCQNRTHNETSMSR